MTKGRSDYHILHELKNKQSIGEALIRNCQGLDRDALDLFLSAYHDDAVVRLDDFCGSAAAYYEWVAGSTCHKVLSNMHWVSNVIVEVDEMTGTIAACESYFQKVVRFLRDDQLFDRIECGRWVDHFECRALNQRCRMGSWKISHRMILPDWDRTEPVIEPTRDCQSRHDLRAPPATEKAAFSFFQRKTTPAPSPQTPPSRH